VFFLSRFSWLYRSIILRILVIVLVLACIIYYALVLPWANRTLSDIYQQHTGHQLQHDTLDVHLFNCNLQLAHLKDSANLWAAAAVKVDIGCMQSLRERSVVINDVSIHQLVINAHQRDDGQWSFNDVLKHQQAIQLSAKKSTQNTPLVIKKITISDSALHSNLLALDNMPLDAAPLNFTLSNIDFRTKNLSGFNLQAELNKLTQLKVAGKMSLTSLSGELDVDATQLPFVWFDSVLKPYIAMDILNGEFELHNHVVVTSGVIQKIIAHGALRDLKIRPTATEQDAVKWKSLVWENAEILLDKKSIHIPSVTLDSLDGQFIIDKNRKTNIQAMFAAVTPAANATPRSSTSVETTPWQFTIDHFAVNKAAIGFYDQSLVPSFTVIVQDFTGNITDISSDENIFSTMNLAGNVDGYSPVTLHGRANLFSKTPRLDALLSFKHMDMGALSPYSAEYAGWRINKGLLSADLKYHYEDGKILGKNHVVIDHLEFGEKVRGTHVVDLPLRLGLALLTDEKGIAVLDTEISGAPSDPQFKMRDVILRALSNTLKKVVMAPFKFLSNLLQTKEDLGRIQFTAGESQLIDKAKEKLNILAEAIKKRPKMRLGIQGVYDQNADLLALKEEQVKSALQKNGVSTEELTSHNEAWSTAVTQRYKASGLADLFLAPEQQYRQLIDKEIVDPERLKKLAHERAQAVKQYFVLQLGIFSETILLDSETHCEKERNCSSSEAIFTLEI